MIDDEGVPCLCCGHDTIRERGGFEICYMCSWEDDIFVDFDTLINEKVWDIKIDDKNFTIEKILDTPSGANHGLTLRQARANYKKFGACEERYIKEAGSLY